MTVAATISIKLDAQTAALKKGFEQTSQATKSLSQQLKNTAGSGILKFNQALSATVTIVGQLRTAISSVFESLDRVAGMADFADRIGIGIEEFQQLQLVVSQFGGNADALGTALQRMGRRIADASRAGGPLADRLRDMGLSVERLALMSADEQFIAISDAIASLATVGERNAVVMGIMDTEGVQFAETMKQGSAAVRAMMEEMSSQIKIGEDQARQAQESAAQTALLKEEFQSSADALNLQLLPALTKAIDLLGKFADKTATAWDVTKKWYRQYQSLWEAGFDRDAWLEIEMRKTMEEMAARDERRRKAQERERKKQEDAAKKMEEGGKKYSDDMKEANKEATEIARKLNIPSGVGAVTSTSLQGFSALQENKRRAREQAAFERDNLALLEEANMIAREIREQLLLVPVNI